MLRDRVPLSAEERSVLVGWLRYQASQRDLNKQFLDCRLIEENAKILEEDGFVTNVIIELMVAEAKKLNQWIEKFSLPR